MLTGRLVALDGDTLSDPGAWMRRLVARLGEPVVRKAMLRAMRILGRQFVLGRDMAEAMRRSRPAAGPGVRYSFDMLGEGARTYADAGRYAEAYAGAIEAIGESAGQARAIGEAEGAAGLIGGQASAIDPIHADGISVKLSALHPRFEYAQRHRFESELAVTLRDLALRAKRHGLGFSIDAEEAARLEPTLDLFESLARDPALAGWDGLGFVLQAYQKRAPRVADWLVALARDTGRRLMVRLVKGAYWDTEIKLAQERGFADYPVFTRKVNTDLCFEVCAARLLAAPEARIFPQFATHNAHTACLVLALARKHRRDSGGVERAGRPAAPALERRRESGAVASIAEKAGAHGAHTAEGFEFQRLHGMGEALYPQLFRDSRAALRIYAPVGSHRDLLPYLVRRLLENGANSSFVNRFLDAKVPVRRLLRDSLAGVREHAAGRNRDIPAPPDLYRHAGENRANAAGLDLDDPVALKRLLATVRETRSRTWEAGAIVNGTLRGGSGVAARYPADRRHIVGTVTEANADDIDEALGLAVAAQRRWNARGGEARAAILENAADLLEVRRRELVGLIGAEGGRTLRDALDEVREAVDFCRYYALQARLRFAAPERLPGPTGERNELSLHGRGVFACISPWNFPLAIFTGQVAAALAAGNAVAAKPAEQTPLIAAEAVRLLHEAGVPPDALHLLPGGGATVGARLVGDSRVSGVAFTGSTMTAKRIDRQLAGRDGPIVPLIAETGGQNVMLVDSTALPEQVVDDVVASAFQSAGQRCSALRVLYLQEDIADEVLTMLAGAMRTLEIGDPLKLETDIGPVIDDEARKRLKAHVEYLRPSGRGRLVAQCALPPGCAHGTFFAPRAFEIDSITQLKGEVFGPVLHVIRFSAASLDAVLAEVESTGYGLTLGVHSRIDGFAREVFEKSRAGNVYVNRDMIGAVVGVHPFGGRGLSGTGPKAGGPNYLPRFATERTRSENVTAKGGNTELFNLRER